MKSLNTFPHLTNSEIEDILRQQKSVRAFQDWQIIYSVQTNSGKTAEELIHNCNNLTLSVILGSYIGEAKTQN